MQRTRAPRHTHAFGTAMRLTIVVLVTLVGLSNASVQQRQHAKRQASLTPPTIGVSDSSTASGTGSASNFSILPIPTTTTALTTSIGPNGTSTFLITLTTLLGPGPSNATSVSGNLSATATTTSTAYPSLGSYSPCVVNCLQTGVSASNCSSITDTSCYCVNSAFTATLVQCVTNSCSNELMDGERLAQVFCNLSSQSISLAFPAPSVSAANAPGSMSTASASASATDSAAVRLGHERIDNGLWLGLGLGAMGMVFSALLC